MPAVHADLPLPMAPPPFDVEWRTEGVLIRPLRTAGEPLAERARMRHCSATHFGPIVAGRAFVFAATVNGRPLTVELLRHAGGRLLLSEIVGRANREPTTDERAAVAAWARR